MKRLFLLPLLLAANAHALNGRVRGHESNACRFEYENYSGAGCHQDYETVHAQPGVRIIAAQTACRFSFLAHGEACETMLRPRAVIARLMLQSVKNGEEQTLNGSVARALGLGAGEAVTLKTVDVGQGFLVADTGDGGHVLFVHASPQTVVAIRVDADFLAKGTPAIMAGSPFQAGEMTVGRYAVMSEVYRYLDRAVTAYKLHLLGF